MKTFVEVLSSLSVYALPAAVLLILCLGLKKKVPLYDTFVQGAGEGLQIMAQIFPYILAIYAAVGVFTAGGVIDVINRLFAPVFNALGVPGEILPLFITRSLSGPAALGVTGELLAAHGPDSFIGRLASTAMGATDTTLYVIALYFASIRVKKSRYAIPVGLFADFVGFAAAVAVCHLYFG